MHYPHSLYIIDSSENNSSLPIYSTINKYLMQDYAVIYAAEQDTVGTISRMRSAGIEVENYIEKGSLKLIDRDRIYSTVDTKLDAQTLLDSWFQLIRKIDKSSKYSGVLAIGTPQAFLETDNHYKLMQYEQKIGTKLYIPVGIICCYDISSIDSIPFRYAIPILSTHQYTIHNDDSFCKWDSEKIISMVEEGLDNALGKGTANLIFKSLRLVYKVDKTTIIQNPEIFENRLRKILGRSADTVMAQITNNIKREIINQRPITAKYTLNR